MKIVVAGGTGHIGDILSRSFTSKGHDVCVLSRKPVQGSRSAQWDGRTFGDWKKEIDGCDVVINRVLQYAALKQ